MANKKNFNIKDVAIILGSAESAIDAGFANVITDATAEDVKTDGAKLVWVMAQKNLLQQLRYNFDSYERGL